VPKIPRFLITTADEATWKFDRPVIFLGEWCRIYDRKHVWQDMDAIVAAPYGLGLDKKDADYAEARALEDRLFPILVDVLNQYHGTRHGMRLWRIVLGHWFRRYVDVIFNRVKTLEQCLHFYQFTGTAAFQDNAYTLATVDSYSAIWAFSDDRWNQVLCIRLLQILSSNNYPVEFIPCEVEEGYRRPTMAADAITKKFSLKWFYQQAALIAGFFTRDTDAFIINSYLPKLAHIKLFLLLRQIPQFWTSQEINFKTKPDYELRLSLSDKVSSINNTSIFGILSSMVFELIPVCYLEGFSELQGYAEQVAWPNKPSCIFTSNSFDTDELFKLWTALKVELGYKYIVGQHGNNWGTHRYMNPAIEEVTADRFFTWGWTDGLLQHTPAFILKTVGHKSENYDPAGGLLLIELHQPHRITIWDEIYEFGEYFSDQFRFIDKLEKKTKEQVTVRLHSGYRYAKWSEISRWNDFDQYLKIDTGEVSIRNIIAQSRLVVHSYDSTGLLETLSQNIPTLAFWQNNLDHLRESAIPYYQLLIDVGIIHLTSESAAMKVNEVWDDVEKWWIQPAVQKARVQFCDRYASISAKPIKKLKELLVKEIK